MPLLESIYPIIISPLSRDPECFLSLRCCVGNLSSLTFIRSSVIGLRAPRVWIYAHPWCLKVETWLSISLFTPHTMLYIQVSPFDPWVGKIPWRRAWWPTPVFLPGEFHRQRSLVGYSPWSCKESDMTKWQTLHFQGLFKPGEGKRSLVNFPSPPSILPYCMALTLSMLCQLSMSMLCSFILCPRENRSLGL